MTVRRRRVLAGLAAPLVGRLALPAGAVALAGAAAGCARGPAAVEVAAVWSGPERVAFEEVLDGYSEPAEIVPTGDDIGALLDARLAASNPPDVAVLPQPGLIEGLAPHLEVLPASLDADLPPLWRELARPTDRPYGVWVKAAHQSLFWYRPTAVRPEPAPDTMDGLLDLVGRLAGGGATPLAVPAADGWVLAAWFANALISVPGGPEVYDRLADRENCWDEPPVRAALAQLAAFWTVPRVFPDGPRRALLTQFEQSVVDVAVTGRAVLTFGADFVGAVLERFADAGLLTAEPAVLRYPAAGGQRPLVVGGDIAVAFSDRGLRLVSWLADPAAVQPWMRRRGFLSPHAGAGYADSLSQSLASDLHGQGAVLRYNLSDRISGGRGIGGRLMWRILQRFFAAVTESDANPRRVVDDAVTWLSTAAGEARRAEVTR